MSNQINYITVSGTYLLQASTIYGDVPLQEIRLLCDTSSAPVSIQLPEISEMGFALNVKIYVSDYAENASVNNITIFASGTDKINGATSQVISTDGGEQTVYIISKTKWGSNGNGNSAGPQIADLGAMLFVSIQGNDTTGKRGRIDLPFATIGAAINAMQSDQDVIDVYAGDYTVSNLIGYFNISTFVLNLNLHPQVNLNCPTGFLIQDILGIGAVSVNIFGNGNILCGGGFAGGIADINYNSTLNLNYDTDVCSSGLSYNVTYGTINVNAKSCTQTLQYFAQISNRGAFNCNIETINNINSARGGCFFFNNTGTGTSRINFGKLYNNANNTFAAVTVVDSVNHNVIVKGDIIMSDAYSYTFLSGAIALSFGTNISYSGNMTLPGCWGLKIYGDTGIVTDTITALLNNTVMKSTAPDSPCIGVNNPLGTVVVNNSIIAGNNDVCVVAVGVNTILSDDANGTLIMNNCQVSNANVADPSTVIGKDGGTFQGGALTLVNSSSDIGATTIQGISGAQNIQILTGGITANLDKDVNITNTVVGTSFIFDSSILQPI